MIERNHTMNTQNLFHLADKAKNVGAYLIANVCFDLLLQASQVDDNLSLEYETEYDEVQEYTYYDLLVVRHNPDKYAYPEHTCYQCIPVPLATDTAVLEVLHRGEVVPKRDHCRDVREPIAHELNELYRELFKLEKDGYTPVFLRDYTPMFNVGPYEWTTDFSGHTMVKLNEGYIMFVDDVILYDNQNNIIVRWTYDKMPNTAEVCDIILAYYTPQYVSTYQLIDTLLSAWCWNADNSIVRSLMKEIYQKTQTDNIRMMSHSFANVFKS